MSKAVEFTYEEKATVKIVDMEWGYRLDFEKGPQLHFIKPVENRINSENMWSFIQMAHHVRDEAVIIDHCIMLQFLEDGEMKEAKKAYNRLRRDFLKFMDSCAKKLVEAAQ